MLPCDEYFVGIAPPSELNLTPMKAGLAPPVLCVR